MITPLKIRNNMSQASSARKDESEYKGSTVNSPAAAAGASAAASASNTPASSPMIRGLSGLGIRSPLLAPLSSSSTPLLFSAHRHIIEMRCPDLLKSALITLPPVATFDEAAASASFTPYIGPRATPGDERKDESGGRSLADQERAAAAAAAGAPSAILQPSAFALSDSAEPSASPDHMLLSVSPALEEKTRGLDDDEDMPGSSGGLIRGMSTPGQLRAFNELHPLVETLEVSCVTTAVTMHNLLTFVYTGDLAMSLLPSVKAVFELATAAHQLRLDRLLDLCALALNRMLQQENFIVALKCALYFQAKVLDNLDTILQDLAEAQAAASASIAGDMHSSHSTVANAKIHPHISPLVRVCFEYIMLHWDICWSSFDNMRALQSLPPALFHTLISLLPMKNLAHAPFSVIYPTVHPQACNLTAHFKRLYEERTPDTTDFRIVIGNDEENAMHVHKAVLGQTSKTKMTFIVQIPSSAELMLRSFHSWL
jgi:hypothetical protein